MKNPIQLLDATRLNSQQTMELSMMTIKRGVQLLTLLTLLILNVVTNAAEMYFIHNDHLGTPQMLTNKDQEIVWQGDYAPFGEVQVGVKRVGFKARFAGMYHDKETNLNYNHHRYYDPSLGRYITADPIGITKDFGDPQLQMAMRMGLPLNAGAHANGQLNHLYNYVDQNPINYVDPFGLAKFSFGFSGSFFVGGAGSNVSGAVGFDTKGNICSTVTVCGRAGGGASTSVRATASVGQGDFCPGESASGGVFAGGGLGPFATISTQTDANADTTVSLGFGVGGGASGGGQACITKTQCL